MKKNSVLLRLMHHSGKYKIFMVLSWIFATASGILNFGPCLCLYFVARELLAAKGDISLLNNEILTYYGWLAVKAAMLWFMVYGIALMFSHLAAFKLMARLRILTIRHLEKLPFGFHCVNPSGKLRKIIDKNAAELENFVAHQLPDTIESVVMGITFLVGMIYVDWRLSLVCVAPIACGMLLMHFMLNEQSGGYIKRYQEALADMSTASVEYVRGVSVVKVFGQTVYSFKRFYDAIMAYKTFITSYTLSMEKPMSRYIASVHGVFFVLIPAGIMFHHWSENKDSFVLSFVFFLIFTPLIPLVLMRIAYRSSKQMIVTQALDTFDGLLNEQPMSGVANPRKAPRYDIVFDSVSFRYLASGPEVLKNVSFTAKQGTITAFAGPSGGGKTTVVNLICRFWDVTDGSIRIGGVDVRQMDYKQWLDQVSFVFQETNLFKTTIAENVAFSKPGATEKQIKMALHLAQCDDIIARLPQGIHTVIGARGIYLSGGEMQRVALARSIIKDAPVVVLDEATAFADPENEYKVQKALNVLMKGKTVIMIAHRLSTITEADNIIVLDHGEIKGSGTHENLIRQNGLYAGMFTDYRTSAAWKIGGAANAQ